MGWFTTSSRCLRIWCLLQQLGKPQDITGTVQWVRIESAAVNNNYTLAKEFNAFNFISFPISLAPVRVTEDFQFGILIRNSEKKLPNIELDVVEPIPKIIT